MGVPLLAFVFAGSLTAQTFRLASDVWPPFTDHAGKNRVALELVETALEQAGYAADVAIVEFSQVMPMVSAREIDGSAALWRDDARESALLYSRAYLENRLVLVGRKGADVSATTLAALAGKKIAYVGDYAYGVESAGAAGPVWVEGSDVQDNFNKLLAGTVDYTVMDSLTVHHLQENYGSAAAEKLAIGTRPLVVRTLHFALRRDIPRVDYIIARFNEEIGRMMSNGTYHRILKLNWINTDLDGDGITELVWGGDGSGSTEPKRSYALFQSELDLSTEVSGASRRFYVEGSFYDSWTEVPESFREAERDFTQDPKEGLLVELKF